jgi:hypothetical protein
MQTPFTEGQTCPRCEFPFAALESEAPPAAGELTVCPGCLAVVRFDGALAPRELTRAEWVRLTPEEHAEIFQWRGAILRLRAQAAQAVLN